LKKGDFGCKTQKGWLLVTITAISHAKSPYFSFMKNSDETLWFFQSGGPSELGCGRRKLRLLLLYGFFNWLLQCSNDRRLEMGPYPTQAYFWPAVNKSWARLWPEYFLTQPEEIFLTRREKIEKFNIFRGNFPNPNPNHRWLTQPRLLKVDPTRNRTKNFDLDTSLWLQLPSKQWFFLKKKSVMPNSLYLLSL